MDYEKAYNEALERAKKVLLDCTSEERKVVEYIFPELRESEDEKIIDDAIQIIRASRLRCAEYGSEADKHLKAIAYLEKQKKPKPGTTEDNPIDPFDTKLFQDGVKEGRRLEREDMLKEQKPVEWSEEDEKMLDECVMALSNWRDAVSNYGHEVAPCQRLIDWLKSFRPQPHWKPSEEQMKSLLYAEGHLRRYECREIARNIAELYNDLKKL